VRLETEKEVLGSVHIQNTRSGTNGRLILPSLSQVLKIPKVTVCTVKKEKKTISEFSLKLVSICVQKSHDNFLKITQEVT
jgi:hypothetical protein